MHADESLRGRLYSSVPLSADDAPAKDPPMRVAVTWFEMDVRREP